MDMENDTDDAEVKRLIMHAADNRHHLWFLEHCYVTPEHRVKVSPDHCQLCSLEQYKAKKEMLLNSLEPLLSFFLFLMREHNWWYFKITPCSILAEPVVLRKANSQ